MVIFMSSSQMVLELNLSILFQTRNALRTQKKKISSTFFKENKP